MLPGLTPHGLRHGHQTWMDEDRIADVLKSERMGHEVPGMRGVYSHVSEAMRAELQAALQERWAASLRERARLASRSIVPVLDALLAEQGGAQNKIGSESLRKSDTNRESLDREAADRPLTCKNSVGRRQNCSDLRLGMFCGGLFPD